MNVSRHVLLLSSLALLLPIAALALASGAEPVPAAAADPVRNVAAATSPAAGANPDRDVARAVGYTAPSGTRLSYDLHLELGLALASDSHATTRETSPFVLLADGTMHVVVIGRRTDDVLVGYRPDALHIAAKGDAQQATQEWCASLQRVLQQGFDVRMDVRGRPGAVRFHGQWTPDQCNFARALTAALRFEFLGSTTWSSCFDDAMGTHTFAYHTEPNGDDLALSRTRTAFVPRNTEGETNVDVQLRGAAVAWFGADVGWLRSATLDDELAWSWVGGALRVSSWLRGSLQWTRSDTIDVQAEWEGGFVDACAADVGNAAGADPMREFWNERLRGLDVTTVLARLCAMLASMSEPNREYHELLQMLAELVRRDPAEAGRLADLVQQARITGQAAADVLAVLGMAGHEQAQAALTAVFENGLVEASLRQAAVESTFQIEHARPALVDSLQRSLHGTDRLDALAGSAMLALGAMGSRGGATADGRPLVDELLMLEATARRDGLEGAYFEALGNTGDPAVLPLAERLLQAADPVERVRALTILRRVVSPRADELLKSAARGDVDADVRRQAVTEVGESTAPWTRDLLIERMAAETDREVRRVLYSALAMRARTDAVARAALVRQATVEPDAELQEMLRSLLGGA